MSRDSKENLLFGSAVKPLLTVANYAVWRELKRRVLFFFLSADDSCPGHGAAHKHCFGEQTQTHTV